MIARSLLAVARRIVNLLRESVDAWVAQQLREATPFGQALRSLIRDRDSKYGQAFKQVAAGSEIEILRTPYHVPKTNAIWERFLGSVRRECLDHASISDESHLYRVITEYVEFVNQARPHHEIERIILAGIRSKRKEELEGKVIAFPVLNGLNHDYQRAA